MDEELDLGMREQHSKDGFVRKCVSMPAKGRDIYPPPFRLQCGQQLHAPGRGKHAKDGFVLKMCQYSVRKTLVLYADKSLGMVSTKIKDTFGVLMGTKLKMNSRGLCIASSTLGEVPCIQDGNAVMNALTDKLEDRTPTHGRAPPALQAIGASVLGYLELICYQSK